MGKLRECDQGDHIGGFEIVQVRGDLGPKAKLVQTKIWKVDYTGPHNRWREKKISKQFLA